MPNKFLSSKFLNKLAIISSLMRLDAPTGYLLAFFPAALGLLLGYEQRADLLYLPVFFLGSILARGMGCIINDIFDQDIDKKVNRTKNRPLAGGHLTTAQAILLLLFLSICCLIILFSLTITAIASGFIAFLMTILYPLTKRVTYFPQVFLGLTFNMGCLIGYATIKDSISSDALILYIAFGCQTVAYDTIYAFMDIEDDKKIGVKSTAIFFEYRRYKLIIASLYIAFFALYLFSFRELKSLIVLAGAILCVIISLWATVTLNVKDANNCLYRFKLNNYIGFILFFSLLLVKL